MKVGAAKRAVVDLGSEYEVWSLPDESLELIREAFGEGWDVVLPQRPDGSEGEHGEVVGGVTGAEAPNVYFGWGIPQSVLSAGHGILEWAHTAAAGVSASVGKRFNASGAILTNSRGIHAEPVSDWVIAAIGFCARGFHLAVAAQKKRLWDRGAFTAPSSPLAEFSSLRVGIVGLGGIGAAVARKAAALGMEVRALRRGRSPVCPPGVSWIGGPDDIIELAVQSDVLVLTLPYTATTAGMVDGNVLRALPQGAYLLNVSRGRILDETALVEELDKGHIGGCVLDVFAKEPLARKHPLWDHPGVLVTPHVSAVSGRFWEREIELIVDNIGRFLRGEGLRNVVNLEVGY